MNEPAPDPACLARLGALCRIAPFDRVREVELALLAEVAVSRAYAPGAPIHAGGAPLARLLIVTGGVVRDAEGRAVGPVCGLASMFDAALVGVLTADATEGAEVLWINKHTFFTLARECPELVTGFLELGPAGAAGSRATP
jgi:signal-transduction protein with cAMP-binding, CBS, and nucleotidyltransferase domain